MCGTTDAADYSRYGDYEGFCGDQIFFCYDVASTFNDCMEAVDCHMNAEMRVTYIDPVTTFMHQMIPHHQNAVNMAKTTWVAVDGASLETTEPDTFYLLSSIIHTQNYQIGLMKDWLEEYGMPADNFCALPEEPVVPDEPTAECVNVNHVNDNPGFYACDCVDPADECLSSGDCVEEPNCPSKNDEAVDEGGDPTEECVCVTEWTSPSECEETQTGCPAVACDSPDEPRWCIVANPGCATDLGGYTECDDSTPVYGDEMDECSYIGNADAYIFDVRTAEELETDGQLSCATNLDYSGGAFTEDAVAAVMKGNMDAVVAVFCRSGTRAGYAISDMESWGYTNLVNVGGYVDVQDCACPEIAEKEPVMIEVALQVTGVTEDTKDSVCDSVAAKLGGVAKGCLLLASRRSLQDEATLMVDVEFEDAETATAAAEVVNTDTFIESLDDLPESVEVTGATATVMTTTTTAEAVVAEESSDDDSFPFWLIIVIILAALAALGLLFCCYCAVCTEETEKEPQKGTELVSPAQTNGLSGAGESTV